MIAEIVIAVFAVLSAWMGWVQKIRSGLIISLVIPAIFGVIVAVAVPLPNNAGGAWGFAVTFVVLAGVSLLSLGFGIGFRRLLVSDKKETKE